MIRFGSTQPEAGENSWRQQLDRFVKAHQQELAALSWGLFLEKGESDDTIGIDLEPTPHFVYCPRQAIATLNEKVNYSIQEILGIVDAHKPDQEVLMIAIAHSQLKLIQFQPDPLPPVCYEQVGADVDTLLTRLETSLTEYLNQIADQPKG